MQLLSCHDGKLIKVDSADLGGHAPDRSFVTGLSAFDGLLAGGAWGRGVVHEILWEGETARPLFVAAFLARAAATPDPAGSLQRPCLSKDEDPHPNPLPQGTIAFARKAVIGACGRGSGGGRIVWSDPRGEVYPPALATIGIPLDRLFLLRPGTPVEEVWAIAECLGCKGVAATVAQPPALSRVEARRLQLAAERGGGVGILMRPRGATSVHHAAATRWLVEPARGERTVQRWKVQLIHGHGGLLHQAIYLECSRDRHQHPQTDRVRAVAQLADRPREAERAGGAFDALRKRSG
jgi:hypothetical protein